MTFWSSGSGFRHQLQDPVLGLANLFLDELDLVLERLVLLVGLGSQHLIAELGDLLLVHLDLAFQPLAILLVGGESGFVGFQFPDVRFESFLDHGDVFGQRGHFFFERGDFLI